MVGVADRSFAGGMWHYPRVHPLPVSLAHVLLEFNRRFEAHGSEEGERPSLLMWANLLRVIPDDGIALRDLPAAARISRRAVRSWVGRLATRGWIQVDVPAPRAKVVRPTETGRRARDTWGDLVAATERDWPVDGIETLRDALEELVRRLDFELPHYPMTYGGSDNSALGGSARRAQPGPPRIPPHGTDWVPVVRTGPGSARGLRLHALLSQALMAFTIDHEERAYGFPMGVAAQLARAMPTPSVPFDTLRAILSVRGDGRSGLERHGFVRVSENGRTATLTDRGVWVRDAYEPGIVEVTQAWRDRYGADVVDALTANLATVDEQLAHDLPDHVLIGHSPRDGFADVSFSV